MRDEIMRLADAAAELRALARTDHVEDKLGMVPEGLPVHPYVRARTLLTLLWQKYDTGGISMGRSFEAVCLEAAMDLLEDFRDSDDVMRCDSDSGNVMDDTRTYLSRQRANREGLAAAPAPDHSAGVVGVVASTLHIPRSESLDPIYCYFEDTKPGAGRITIACFGDAWTAAWGAMGDRTVRQFVAECDSYYLTNSLLQLRGANKRMRDYTGRIGASVIAALAQPADADSEGGK